MNSDLANVVVAIFTTVATVISILSAYYTWRITKTTNKKDLYELWANLHQVRNEYIRFSRGDRDNPADPIKNDPDEHSRIISVAQYICRRAAWHSDRFEKCPQSCLDISTEKGTTEAEFRKQDSIGRLKLKYIALIRLTPNQVLEKDNSLECRVWGIYKKRNEDALNDAINQIEATLARM